MLKALNLRKFFLCQAAQNQKALIHKLGLSTK